MHSGGVLASDGKSRRSTASCEDLLAAAGVSEAWWMDLLRVSEKIQTTEINWETPGFGVRDLKMFESLGLSASFDVLIKEMPYKKKKG